jgi:hypothetical protein
MSDKKDFNLTPGENEQYKPVKADITCRKCGKKDTLTLRACVNVSLHPEEKQQVLDGSFFTYKCPDCGEEMSIVYPLLYDDMAKALMIYLLPDQTEEALAKLNAQQKNWSDEMLKAAKVCTMRAVRSINELAEKINIADAGLDDRFVELSKAFVFAQFLKQKQGCEVVQVLFERQNEKDGIVIFSKDGKQFWVEFPEGLYDEVVRMFEEKVGKSSGTEYELIDAGWSMKILADINKS